MLVIVGLNWRSPKDGIKRRTPKRVSISTGIGTLHDEGSLHTENNKKTSSCLPVLERKIDTF
jgi:hypothetical protein